jgi:hypothetical protein
VANVDRLEKRIVERFDQNQELSLLSREVIGRLASKRAGFVDGMNDRPGERQELDGGAFERQGLILAQRSAHSPGFPPFGKLRASPVPYGAGQAFRGDLSRRFEAVKK